MAAGVLRSACQICFNDIEAPTLITKFCGSKCPARICASCLKRHVEVALEVPYTGALPRVKCPVCLVPVNRERWSERLSKDDPERATLRLEYRRLCLTSCRFQVPCCDNPDYIHMPAYYTTKLTARYARHAVLVANADALLIADKQRKKRFLCDLRSVGERFCRHDAGTTAGDVVRFLEDSFPDYDAKSDVYSLTNELQIAYQLLATRIRDEERRASLVLAFYRRHPHMLTRCCGALMCFNCKRTLRLPASDATKNSDNGGDHALSRIQCVCERQPHERAEGKTTEIDICDWNCIVQCRSCRVMLVLVEGCDAVTCPCGFDMIWADELQLRDLARRNLVPVDIFDTRVFSAWRVVTSTVRTILKFGTFHQIRIRKQVHLLARREAGNPHGLIETLRRFALRRQFTYRLRDEWAPVIRRKLVARRFPRFIERLRRFVWRRRFDKVVGGIHDGYKERSRRLQEARQRECLRRLYESVVLTG